ncbi:hypothetical protein [Arthrobacter sp. 131MFCol6.1]|jgi:hypothetical protein|uniref:hypothetical protein n=1 Tax=Arthrobacter sp. 131MFCol6.1 TaxID=1157944 RepID=UPI00037C155F|nr:hypothetical protein [Arthrobacter sp. 131MFCol6.1]
MFVVEATKDGRDHRVIDRDANVYLKWLVAGGPYFTEVFSLVHAGGSIPFTTAREEGIDAESALPYFVYRFLTFGSAPKAHRNTKHLVNRTFDDEVEKRCWKEVATEALLVFGWAYNGLKAPHPSYTRVDLDGKIYTLKDFGYALNSK